MGIAYTQRSIFFGPIRGDTSAHLRGDLDTALLSVGWAVSSLVTNGKIYGLTAPNGLAAKVLIQDQGGHDIVGHAFIVVQIMSADETALGYEHSLIYGAGAFVTTGYQLVAGCCQMFLSVPGTTGQVVPFNFSSQVALGIPSLPPDVGTECTANGTPSHTVTDLWWSCGDGIDTFVQAPSFRLGRNCFRAWSVSLNKAVTIPPQNNSRDPTSGMLCYYPLTPTYNIDAAFPAGTDQVQKYDGASNNQPMNLDALMGWNFAVQGQLWDAFLISRDGTLDQVRTVMDSDVDGNPLTLQVITWNNGGAGEGSEGTYYGALCLLINPPVTSPRFINYAY